MGDDDRRMLPPEIATLSGPKARALAARQQVELARLREDGAQPLRLHDWVRSAAVRAGKHLIEWGMT